MYGTLSVLVNFFYPSVKLIKKTRYGSKVRRIYDQPQTPYQRMLQSPAVDAEVKARLKQQYATLNPGGPQARADQIDRSPAAGACRQDTAPGATGQPMSVGGRRRVGPASGASRPRRIVIGEIDPRGLPSRDSLSRGGIRNTPDEARVGRR